MHAAVALAAIKIGQRPADDARTIGYRRFEILAAAFNSLLLFAVASYVLWEGIQRFFEPAEVQSTGMLIVAAIGLAVNIIAMRLLSAGKERSLNVKGAYLEVWTDMLGSIGVLVGALVIMFTGWQCVDPFVAIGIGLWVRAPGSSSMRQAKSCWKGRRRVSTSVNCGPRSRPRRAWPESTTSMSGH